MNMMQMMIAYSTAMLEAISEWLSAEPMIYVFGLLMGAFVINFILTLIGVGRRTL